MAPEPVPATWFQKSRCWDPPPGRLAQCRPSGRHWCVRPWSGRYRTVVVLEVLPSVHGDQALRLARRRGGDRGRGGGPQDGVSFSAWLSSAAEKQLRVRQGLRGVAAWEGETGSLSAEELAAGEALLARLRSGVSGVASRVRRR